jgi:CubicO group peptidase (beta-lactamase class C family)
MGDLDLLLIERHAARLIAPYDRPDQPGVVVGVVRDGALVVHRQAGMASLELGVPLGPASVFRIASVSKQFTCAAILLLAAEGRLSPDDDVRTHLPELADFGARITLDHLMHNTSGLRDMLELMRLGGVDLGMPIARDDLLAAILRQRTLNFAPGTGYLYSNTNFFLLGLIVERVTGQSLPAFLEARIFTPLGMNRTRMVESTSAVVPGLATGYLPDKGGWVRAAHGFPIGGEGGLVSGVEDLALWVRNMSTGRAGGKGLAAGLEVLAPFNNGLRNNYARGLSVRDYRGARAVDHGGLWPGYKTEFLRVPEFNLAVIVISNNGGADPYHLAHHVLDSAIEGRPGIHALAALPDAASLRKLAGRWLDRTRAATLDIAINEDGVPVVNANGVPFLLRMSETGKLVASRSANDFTAVLTDHGATLDVELDAGATATFVRIAEGATLPADLPGRYGNDEIGADWTIAVSGEAMTMAMAIDGPLRRRDGAQIEPVEGDFIRIVLPGNLYRAWADARVLRDASGAVTGLAVRGGRARNLVFSRIA